MATYTPPSITGYNSNPPPNDGSQSIDNKVDWDREKTNLTDPIVDYATNINNAAATAFNSLDATVVTKEGAQSLTNKTLQIPYILDSYGPGQTQVYSKLNSSTFTSNTTLTDIGLPISIKYSSLYSFEVYLICNDIGDGGINISLDLTSATVYSATATIVQSDATALAYSNALYYWGWPRTSLTASTFSTVHILGVINGTSGGSIGVKAAQYSSNADTLTIRSNSWIKLTGL